MRSELHCVMSSLRRRTVPEEAVSSPDRRLTSVDLPAPLGPIMACMPRVSKSSDTRSTAVNPPKRRVRFAVASIGSGIAILVYRATTGTPPGRERLRQSCKPLRKKQHRDDDESTHQQRPMPGNRREPLLEEDVREGADHRAEEGSHSTEDQ